jgi:dolichol-phosphate mannosyltransferase
MVMKNLILVQSEEEWAWLGSFNFEEFGMQAVCLSLVSPPKQSPLQCRQLAAVAKNGPESIADFGFMLYVLEDEKPNACFALRCGLNADLLRVACKARSVPLFSVISTEQDFNAIPLSDGGSQDGFFLASKPVLLRALGDARYGRSLIPTGAPMPNGNGNQSAVRMLSYVQMVAAGKQPEKPAISIIVPAFNEALNLTGVCDQLIKTLNQVAIPFEILLIDDASTDETYEIAVQQMWKSPSIRAFKKPTPRGMGNAIRYGFERAQASVIAITMADGSDEVERIPAMFRALQDQGGGLIIGSRYRRPENYQNIPFLYRLWSRCFRLAARLFVGVRLSDYTNAFRVFDREIFARYGAESGGFEISPETTFKAWFATHSIGEVDVRQLKRASGQSKFSFMRAGPGYGRVLGKAIVNRLTGKWFTLDW